MDGLKLLAHAIAGAILFTPFSCHSLNGAGNHEDGIPCNEATGRRQPEGVETRQGMGTAVKVLLVTSGAANSEWLEVQRRRLPQLLQRLQVGGTEIHVALIGDAAGLGQELRGTAESISVLPLALHPSLKGVLSAPSTARRLRQLIDQIAPSVIDAGEPLAAIAASIARGRAHAPVIVYRRHHQSGRKGLLVASRIAARWSDRTAIPTEVLLPQVLRDDRCPREKVLVTSSGTTDLRRVEGHEIENQRRQLGILDGTMVIGAISRLRREKGLDVLLECLGHLRSNNLQVVIVGSGPEHERLRQLAQRSGVPVHLVGHQEDVALWYALTDIVVIPSRSEAFGRTTVEAMAAGRPVIASDVGGLAEGVVHEVTGLLVPPEDPKALASAISKLISNDPQMDHFARSARLRFESSYTIDSMARSWLDGWQRAVKEMKGEP